MVEMELRFMCVSGIGQWNRDKGMGDGVVMNSESNSSVLIPLSHLVFAARGDCSEIAANTAGL